MGKIQVHSITEFEKVGYVTLNESGNETDGIVLYRMLDDEHCGIYYVEVDEKNELDRDQMLQSAFDDIISAKRIPVPTCQVAKEWYEKKKQNQEQQEEIKSAVR